MYYNLGVRRGGCVAQIRCLGGLIGSEAIIGSIKLSKSSPGKGQGYLTVRDSESISESGRLQAGPKDQLLSK